MMRPVPATVSVARRALLASLAVLFALTIDAAPAQAQGFGATVATADGEVLVADPTSERRPGTIYVYRRGSDGSWTEAAQLQASDAEAGDHFGRALAVQGATLWTGATVVDSGAGAAYLFERSESGEWTQTARFQPEDLQPEESFGRTAAVDGDFALVSSWGHQDGRGAVWVYRRGGQDGSWSQYGKLMAGDAASNDWFGQSVSIAGDVAAVGAPRKSGRTGAVYLFRHQAGDGTWTQTAKIRASDAGQNAQFGTSIAFDGERLIVGAPGYDNFSGAVFSYEWNAEEESWELATRLLPFDGQRGSGFGATLARADGELWVGAPGAGDGGRIYRFSGADEAGGWAAVDKLVPAEVERGDDFAATLAVGDGVAVSGLTGDDFGAGTALVLERDESGQWATGGKVFNELESLAAVTGGSVACGEDGEAAHFQCEGIDLVSFLPVSAVGGSRGVEVNDIWGWTDPETGREYALVGRVDGTAFVDVTEPENPRYLGSLPLTEGARPNTWRDIKVYENHAFVVADGAGDHGVQIFDLTRLRDVQDAPATFDEDAHYDRVASVHNIVINTESGFAYAVGAGGGGETCGGGLHMIDVRDPLNPTFAGCFADTRTGRQGTGYTHDGQCVMYRGPDEEHRGKEICMGANETALSVADVSDKSNPLPISIATYPNVGYAHQGWFGPDQRYFYLDDELDELQGKVERTRTMVWDVTDLDDPIMAAEFFGPTNSSDHNLYVVGDRIFQSNYQSGLRVLDASDPENLQEIGWFDTVPFGENDAGFGGSWSNYPFFDSGIVVVTSGYEGLFVVRPTEGVAASPEALGSSGPAYSRTETSSDEEAGSR